MPKSKVSEVSKKEGSKRSNSNESSSSQARVTPDVATGSTGISGSYGGLIGGDYSQGTFENHAALLGSERFLHPSNAIARADMVRRLQSDYGNKYVQRLVSRVRATRVDGKQPQSQVSMADVLRKLEETPLDYQADDHEIHHPWEAFLPRMGRSPSSSTVDVIQPSLTVGAAGDKYEQEADRVAQEVVRGTSASESEEERVQRIRDRTLAIAHRMIQMQREGEMARLKAPEEQPAVGMEGGAVSPDVSSDIEGARGSGQALPDNVKGQMEAGFGTDFSGVKIHTGPKSDDLNKSMSARAFTTGSDIFFANGEYNPGSKGGQETLAHELTHVVQQNGDVPVRRAEGDSEYDSWSDTEDDSDYDYFTSEDESDSGGEGQVADQAPPPAAEPELPPTEDDSDSWSDDESDAGGVGGGQAVDQGNVGDPPAEQQAQAPEKELTTEDLVSDVIFPHLQAWLNSGEYDGGPVPLTDKQMTVLAQAKATGGYFTNKFREKAVLNKLDPDQKAEILSRAQEIKKHMYGEGKFGTVGRGLFIIARWAGLVGKIGGAVSFISALISPLVGGASLAVAKIAKLVSLMGYVAQAFFKSILIGMDVYRINTVEGVKERAQAWLQLKRDAKDLFLSGLHLLVGGLTGGFKPFGGMEGDGLITGAIDNEHDIGALGKLNAEEAKVFWSDMENTVLWETAVAMVSQNVNWGANANTAAGEENLRLKEVGEAQGPQPDAVARSFDASLSRPKDASIKGGKDAGDTDSASTGSKSHSSGNQPIQRTTDEEMISELQSMQDELKEGDQEIEASQQKSEGDLNQLSDEFFGGDSKDANQLEDKTKELEGQSESLDGSKVDKSKADDFDESKLNSADKDLDKAGNEIEEEITAGSEEKPKKKKKGFFSRFFGWIKRRVKNAIAKVRKKVIELIKEMPGVKNEMAGIEAQLIEDRELNEGTIKPDLAEILGETKEADDNLSKMKAALGSKDE